MENEFRISRLIIASLRGILTESEKVELESWRSANEQHSLLLEKLSDNDHIAQELDVFFKINKDSIWKKVQKLKKG